MSKVNLYVGDQLKRIADALEETPLLVRTERVPAQSLPINIIFDGPPGNESGRFVEVESDDGRSISVGQWLESGDHPGYWKLRITELPPAERP